MNNIKVTQFNEIKLINKLSNFFQKYNNKGGVLVLTGAGISTDSGIPDYRGPKGAYVVNPSFKPITYQEFISSYERRQRYWTRSFFGYPKFNLAKPNHSHEILAKLEKYGFIQHIITQNVDSLHYMAGSKNITEIHGTLRTVECLNCKTIIERSKFQTILKEFNPIWNSYLESFLNNGNIEEPPTTPDGDVLLPESTPFKEFHVPNCINCNKGFYKPSVVFFGENMKLKDKERSKKAIEDTHALLVIGSSLTTPSAYRLVVKAKEDGKEVGILNIGNTRADSIVDFKLEDNSSKILKSLLNQLII